MEQHAVPQSITTYKFRLVGDMTLKQFLELAFGLGIAWLIFSSKLGFLLKWTLAPSFTLLGFGLAFVPIEDRPLDQWLLNFFKALFRPTQFIYKPGVKTINIFTSNPPPPPETHPKSSQPGDMEEYLKTLPTSPATAFEQSEQKYLEHITSLFGTLGFSVPAPTTPPQPQPANPYKSNIKGVRIRKLLTPQMCLLPHNTIFEAPTESKQAAIQPIIKTATAPHVVSSLSRDEVGPIAKIIPAQAPIAVKQASGQNPVFAADLVLPHPPDKPNLICGITLDPNGKILPGVIIEIIDKQNLPVRALKSNKLGQFYIATPLNDGVFQIQAEQTNHKFAIIKLEAKGEIIPPLKIQAI